MIDRPDVTLDPVPSVPLGAGAFDLVAEIGAAVEKLNRNYERVESRNAEGH
jgi:hypothetical protein